MELHQEPYRSTIYNICNTFRRHAPLATTSATWRARAYSEGIRGLLGSS